MMEVVLLGSYVHYVSINMFSKLPAQKIARNILELYVVFVQ